jgi:uncharacterized membrane protein
MLQNREDSVEEEKIPVEIKDEDRILLLFAYLGPLSIVSLLASRKEFVKWHSKQGFIFFIVWMAFFIILVPIYKFFYLIWLGWLIQILGLLIGLGIFSLIVFCIVRAIEGEKFKIPFVGDLADRF